MLRTLDPHTRNPYIIDPACGEGAFLAYALEHKITSPERIYGVEKDPEIAAALKNLGQVNLLIDDSLASITLPAIAGSRRMRDNAQRSTLNAPEGGYDWVVGNPPFGTKNLTGNELDNDFTIWQGRESLHYPIEILFLERFWQLAKPDGYVAIIVPDGILANARLSYVREWLSQRAAIKAIISLPQHTFHRTGAAAKASILVFRRIANSGQAYMAALKSNEPVLMRALEPDMWEVHLLNDGARWDPAYYHPKYIENLHILESLPNVVRFGELIEYTTYGQVGAREYTQSGVRLLTPANLITTSDGYVTGIDIHSPERFVAPGSRNDPPRSRLQKGDLLLANSGVGCIGRAAVFKKSDEPCNISQHINLVRVKGIEPEYLAVYLQTRFAQLQIHREKCGVGPCGINFDRIKSILVPILPEDLRQEVVKGYARLPAYPDSVRRLVKELEHSIAEGRKCV